MRRFDTKRDIGHSADDMYALVADIEHYPKFVPLCERTRIIKRRPVPDGEQLLCTMTVAYKAFNETFTTRATLMPARREILVEYIDGPFRVLENRWSFAPLAARLCEVEFFIAYEFRSRMLEFVAGAVFDRAFRKFVDAFEARADVLYGRAARPQVETKAALR